VNHSEHETSRRTIRIVVRWQICAYRALSAQPGCAR